MWPCLMQNMTKQCIRVISRRSSGLKNKSMYGGIKKDKDTERQDFACHWLIRCQHTHSHFQLAQNPTVAGQIPTCTGKIHLLVADISGFLQSIGDETIATGGNTLSCLFIHYGVPPPQTYLAGGSNSVKSGCLLPAVPLKKRWFLKSWRSHGHYWMMGALQ